MTATDDGVELQTTSLRAVADAARQINQLVRTTRVRPDQLAVAEALLRQAGDVLADDVDPGPHCQVGHAMENVFDGELDDPASFFPYSPVIGPLNPVSPPVVLEIGSDKVVRGHMTLTEAYNGPPWDLAHGGVVALVFDEMLGIAGIAGAGGGFTGRLTVRYHKPTPILQKVELVAWLDRVEGRKLIAKGEMRYQGEITAVAEGVFIQKAGILSES